MPNCFRSGRVCKRGFHRKVGSETLKERPPALGLPTTERQHSGGNKGSLLALKQKRLRKHDCSSFRLVSTTASNRILPHCLRALNRGFCQVHHVAVSSLSRMPAVLPERCNKKILWREEKNQGRKLRMLSQDLLADLADLGTLYISSEECWVHVERRIPPIVPTNSVPAPHYKLP